MISNDELKQLFHLFLKKLNEFKEIDLVDADMYWSISAPESYDLTQKPKLIVGSLNDDVEQLLKLLHESDRPITFVDFDRLGAVLHAMSEGMNPVNE